ncbi:hypothetical protein VTK73DRAFT_8525 [Phialemonium thermophilum]|uniref:Pali-domain-containing protein n=1 Tax=Phialemonium thermophilum TaxID=223376 RepID=A0ABR3W804_9PEZI
MARTGFFHHVGTFLLFAACILVLITCITAPTVRELSILKVDLGNTAGSDNGNVAFGTFGYCLNHVQGDRHFCTKAHVGYYPTDVISSIDNTDFSHAARTSTRALTKVMILHPIACGIDFLAFVLALGAGVVGSLLASLVALVGFVVTVVVLITDFVLFAIVRRHVNHDDTSGAHAHYGPAAWTLLASAVCALLGTIVVFFTCCSARLHERHRSSMAVKGDGYPATRRRRWI